MKASEKGETYLFLCQSSIFIFIFIFLFFIFFSQQPTPPPPCAVKSEHIDPPFKS